ncbi:MAG: hypothetical protein EOO09_20285 [Chitinophagaceae bacterium]|nr:MAG: hypothetical protein EOO09_20285 [Chitinophagaceae bacterium]
MKRTAIITGIAFLAMSATVNAQTDSTMKTVDSTVTGRPATNDKYNNWSSDQYKMQPMPEGITQDKVFPVVGRYDLTDKEGTQSQVSISLDETNKGFVWVDGLPQGRIKAILRKSPATYKIPAQKLGEEKDAKSIAEGVMIYDKDANLLNVCIGCTFDNENPGIAFQPADAAVTEEAAATDATAKKAKTAKTAKTAKSKVAKVKPVHYSGTKVIEQTAVATPVQ